MGRRTYIVTAEEMRNWEQQWIEQGVSSDMMMESTGGQLWGKLQSVVPKKKEIHCVILAGSGNNGGDALVLARYAWAAGWYVTVILFGHHKTVENASRLRQLEMATEGSGRFDRCKAEEIDQPLAVISTADIAVEGIVGTGLQGELCNESQRWVAALNEWRRWGGRVAAIDVPAGVNGTNGDVTSVALQADMTWMTGWPKRGLYFYPASEYTGKKLCFSLGLPGDPKWKNELVVSDTLMLRRPLRKNNAHKGTQGHVAILAGSEGMEGAALLAAQAALYSGAGKVTLWVPRGIRSRLTLALPEIMVRSVGNNRDTIWTPDMIPDVDPQIYDSVVLGCGIGRAEETMRWAVKLLTAWKQPTVLDADGLLALVRQKDIKGTGTLVLTPHAGELACLSAQDHIADDRQRWETSVGLAATRNTIVVAKGAPTFIALPTGEHYVNTTGNAGLATAGTGDTLAGIIGSLMAQGFSAVQAAVSGVYWHGAAADILAAGGYGFTAGMVARTLPSVMGKGATDARG